MSNYGNFVCTECGNFYTNLVNYSGNPTSSRCENCITAANSRSDSADAKLLFIVLGVLTAAVLLLYSKYKNPKKILIAIAIFFSSILIIGYGGFWGFCVVAIGLYLGWKHLKKAKLIKNITSETELEPKNQSINPDA